MGLQLTGAYKHTTLANLQVGLPAVVIGGGLTAIDTATELLAYYIVADGEDRERASTRSSRRAGPRRTCARCSTTRSGRSSSEQLSHARRAPRGARPRAAARGARRDVQRLLDAWGGVSARLPQAPRGLARLPAEPRGGRSRASRRACATSRTSPPSRRCSTRAAHVRASSMQASRRQWTGSAIVELPARTVCVAAGTSPNVTYEKEYPGTFQLDEWRQFFQRPRREGGRRGHGLVVEPSPRPSEGFFTSYDDGKTRLVLRRQPPALRRQRGEGDGEREGRLPARRRALPRRSRRLDAERRSRRATPAAARSSRSSTRSSSPRCTRCNA